VARSKNDVTPGKDGESVKKRGRGKSQNSKFVLETREKNRPGGKEEKHENELHEAERRKRRVWKKKQPGNVHWETSHNEKLFLPIKVTKN